MFNKLFRNYNQNRKTIWTVIISIAFFVILLQTVFALIRSSRNREQQELLNAYYQNQNNNSSNTNINTNTSIGNKANNEITNNVSDKPTNNSTTEEIINYFVKLCNESKLEEAYNMLSSDCKKAIFQTQNDFKNNYYNKVFTKKRSAKIEDSMYGSSVYKVTYYADLLSSGYKTQDALQDYIYIVDESGEKKLSISQFLYTQNINRQETIENISIKVIRKLVYLNYETYEIQITNNTENKILLTKKEEPKGIYFTNEKKVTHSANIGEIALEQLIILPKTTSIIQIKNDKVYSQGNSSISINFAQIIKNYEQYQKGEEPEQISLSISW